MALSGLSGLSGLSALVPGVTDAPPVAGYSLWLDVLRAGSLWQDTARTTPATSGTQVASWYDPTADIAATQSGATARPIVVSAGLEFDGVNDMLDAAIGARPSAETVYMVQQRASTGNFHVLYSATSANSGRAYWYSGNHQLWSDSNAVPILTPASSTVRGVVAVAVNGTSAVARFNSTTGSAITVPAISGSGLRIGAQASSPFPFAGTIAAVLYYSAAHDATQRAAVVSWLAARHGVSL